jgi:membrane-associated protease RseP (regulator of RpoE activity)
MRAIFNLLLLIIFALTGCVHSVSQFFIKDYEIGKTQQVTVGSTMMTWGSGIRGGMYNATLDGLRKELLYSGIAQNIIQISYREFSLQSEGAYARQSFYQDLKYDIKGSKIIMFQDIKIQIDTADQQKIKFIVLQGPSEIESEESGRIGIIFDPDGTIQEIERNSPASKSGLEVGDKIIRIDGELAPQNNSEAMLSRISGEPGSEVTLLIVRNGKEHSFIIKRKKM